MNTGIICEFNPFHAGHRHLIAQVKRENDGILCVMSGNFVQRGEPAVYNKAQRTRAALAGGADLVIELPTPYATLSAEGFARAGVCLIEATGIADRIAFGAENDDIDALYRLADELKNHQTEISAAMKNGLSYPAARKQVLHSPLLDTPNNILALEYIHAASLPCICVKRIGEGHDSADAQYSASAIRSALPQCSIAALKNCETAVLAAMRRLTADDFKQYTDVHDGLESRLEMAAKTAVTLEELYSAAKTKNCTHARIRRIVLRAYLDIKDGAYPQTPPYLRILGFNEKGKTMLGAMKRNAKLPIVTRTADIKKLNNAAQRLFDLECRCTDLYNLAYKKPLPGNAEQRYQIVSI